MNTDLMLDRILYKSYRSCCRSLWFCWKFVWFTGLRHSSYIWYDDTLNDIQLWKFRDVVNLEIFVEKSRFPLILNLVLILIKKKFICWKINKMQFIHWQILRILQKCWLGYFSIDSIDQVSASVFQKKFLHLFCI